MDESDQDVYFVGYVPRYLAQDISPVLEMSHNARITVLRVNPPPAPVQFRVLCCFVIQPPAGVQLFEGEEFSPIRSYGSLESQLPPKRPN
jgi:hypothetical protein